MKKLLLAAVAILTIGSASSSFAGGCGTSYVVHQNHYQPQTHYVAQQPCHRQVIAVPVHQPCHREVIVRPPCHTTYVKPCVQTYTVQAPVIYNHGCNYTPVYHRSYTSSCGGY